MINSNLCPTQRSYYSVLSLAHTSFAIALNPTNIASLVLHLSCRVLAQHNESYIFIALHLQSPCNPASFMTDPHTQAQSFVRYLAHTPDRLLPELWASKSLRKQRTSANPRAIATTKIEPRPLVQHARRKHPELSPHVRHRPCTYQKRQKECRRQHIHMR